MKKRTLLPIAVALVLSSCGGGESNTPNPSTDTTPTSSVTTDTTPSTDTTPTSSTDDPAEVNRYIQAALAKLDELVNPAITKMSEEDLKAAIQEYYDTEKAAIERIVDLTSAKNAVNKVIDDTIAFVRNTLRPYVISKIDDVINPLIAKITYEELKNSVQSFYDTEMAKVSATDSLEEVADLFREVIEDTKAFIVAETEKAIAKLKELAISKLDELVNPVIAKIPDEELKTAVQGYYDTEKQYINEINDLETAEGVVNKVIEDTKVFARDTLKPIAIRILNDTINPLIAKITYEELKNAVQSFYDTEMAKIATVETLEDVSRVFEEILDDTKDFIFTETEKAIKKFKDLAIAKLDELVQPAIELIPDEDLKTAVQSFYDLEISRINELDNLDAVKDYVDQVIEDVKAFVKDTFKPLAINKVNSVINPLILEIKYEELKTTVQDFFDAQMAKIDAAIDSLEEAVKTYKSIIDNTRKFLSSETERMLIDLKNKALQVLDPYVNALIERIPYEPVKNDLQTFYNEEKAVLEAVNKLEEVDSCVERIKKDLADFALREAKKYAVEKLQEIVNESLAKIPNPEIKEDLQTFADEEFAKLNAVQTLEEIPTTLETVIQETQEHVKTLLVGIVKEYVRRLTEVEHSTAYDYLPEAMSPSYSANVVSASNIAYDFTTNTNVSSISRAGYGEQWQMVVENINQSVTMANIFNIAQTALNAAGNAVDIYITNSYAEEMHYEFSGEGYSGLFEFRSTKLTFNISLTTDYTVPGVGTVRPVIRMEYDLLKDEKGMFISLGDAYKVKYVIGANKYEMATTYGLTIAGKNGSRSSYLSINKNGAKTTGHIYEYTTYEGSDKIQACADFYIENDYVSVVGNKSSGMVGFAGYINELYLANEGRLIGYEVREELEILGVKGTYNTLWFNLWDIQGINSIKVTDKTKANSSSKSTVDVYINGSSTMFVPTYNTKLAAKTSRKHDVELRNRYYYTYDSENNKYVSNEVKVPMMFVQEGDNFNSFTADISKANGINLSVSLAQAHLNKILSDYDTLIDIFIANKDTMSSEMIIEYLSQYED